MFVTKVFLVVKNIPLRMNRTTTVTDASHTFSGERDETEQHTRVNGEVIHALLRLLDQRVAKNFPSQVFRYTVDLFQRLVNRHRADRNRRVTNNPFAGLVDVLAGG